MKNLIDLIVLLINRKIRVEINSDFFGFCVLFSYNTKIGWSYVNLKKGGRLTELFIQRNMTADDFFNSYKGDKLYFMMMIYL